MKRILIKLFIYLVLFLAGLGLLKYATHWDFTLKGLQSIYKEQVAKLEAYKDDEEDKKLAKLTRPELPFVRIAEVAVADKSTIGLSGVIKARHEIPIAFQINGRIVERNVDAGQKIKAGKILFELDDQDIKESIQSAQADVNSAQAHLNTALLELERNQSLHNRQLTSTQALDQAQLVARQARAQLMASKARLSQAKNTGGYAILKSPESGTLLSVIGEAGQVVATGQAIAMLAVDGMREVEVAFPDYRRPPEKGFLVTTSGEKIPLYLRQISGEVSPQSRTWQVRYTIDGNDFNMGLGSIVRTQFDAQKQGAIGFSIPIAALDERGEGARIWQVVDGRARAKPIKVIKLAFDSAEISGDVKAGDFIISLGTHLLTDGMKVRELRK